jgi:O-antigen/teichoic acid export membrane protein
VFAAGARLVAPIGMVQAAMNGAIAPRLAGLHHRGELAGMREEFQLATRWNITIAAPVLLLVWLYGPALLRSISVEFAEGAQLLGLLCAAQAIDVCFGPVGILVAMSGKPHWRLLNLIGSLVFGAALGLWAVPAYGLTGAGLVNIATCTCINAIGMAQAWRMLRAVPYSLGLVKPIAAAAVAGCAGALARSGVGDSTALQMAVPGLVCVLVYAACLVAFGLPMPERQLLQRLGSRVLVAS